jgi:hypothetical protein
MMSKIGNNLTFHVVSSGFVSSSHERSKQWHYNRCIRRNRTPNVEYQPHEGCISLHNVQRAAFWQSVLLKYTYCCQYVSGFVCLCDYSAAVSVADHKDNNSGLREHVNCVCACACVCVCMCTTHQCTFVIHSLWALWHYVCIQGVPGGMWNTSGECSLC